MSQMLGIMKKSNDIQTEAELTPQATKVSMRKLRFSNINFRKIKLTKIIWVLFVVSVIMVTILGPILSVLFPSVII